MASANKHIFIATHPVTRRDLCLISPGFVAGRGIQVFLRNGGVSLRYPSRELFGTRSRSIGEKYAASALPNPDDNAPISFLHNLVSLVMNVAQEPQNKLS